MELAEIEAAVQAIATEMLNKAVDAVVVLNKVQDKLVAYLCPGAEDLQFFSTESQLPLIHRNRADKFGRVLDLSISVLLVQSPLNGQVCNCLISPTATAASPRVQSICNR